jgi:hypothetical protein
MATHVHHLGKLFCTVVPDNELKSDDLRTVIAARDRVRNRIVAVRYPDGHLDTINLDDGDFDIIDD